MAIINLKINHLYHPFTISLKDNSFSFYSDEEDRLKQALNMLSKISY